jgi:ABC-type lipoprotein export system ATPase subunit
MPTHQETPTTGQPLIRAEGLTRIYGEQVQVYALNDVSFEVHAGEIVAIMGPSGSGKSTLLNMLGALDRPTQGRVIIDGQDLAKVRDLDTFRARTVGFVFQMHNLIPTLTAIENVEVPMRGQISLARKRRQRARDLLALVGLSTREDHLPSQLSGGQRQRVAIARSLANDPSLILADEPTGNLDSTSGEEIITLLQRLNQEQGATVVIVTHDRNVARATQRILLMGDGRIAASYRVRDPLTEDLRSLARSELGRRIIAGDAAALNDTPFAEEGTLTETAQRLAQSLQDLL